MPARIRKARIVALAGVATTLAAIDLGVRVFANNDEARFPVLAQEVLGHGAWLFPELNGNVYLNKPLLLAWLIAAVSWPAQHVTQLTAVLPSALAGIATVVFVYCLGRQLFGDLAGWYAALIAATTQGLFLHERLAMPDMLLVALQTASVWMLARMRTSPGGVAWTGFYGVVAAAFWVKGLPALLPLAVAAAYAGFARRRLGLRWLRLGTGLPLLVVLIVPWWILGLARDSQGVHRALVIDQLLWYLPRRPDILAMTAPLRHLFGILFPWVVLVPSVAVAAGRFLRGSGAEREAVLFVVTWGVAVLALVAPSHQQRLRYYLPAVAPAALLIGWWLAGLVVRRRAPPRVPWSWCAAGAVFLVLGTLATTLSRAGRWAADAWLALPGSVFETVLLVVAGGVMLAALAGGALHHRVERGFPVAFVAAAVLVGGMYHGEVQRRNRTYDFRGALPALHSSLDGVPSVAAWGLPELPLAFYLGRPVAGVTGSQDVLALAAGTGPVVIVAGGAALEHVTHIGGLRPVGDQRLGTQRVVLASLEPPTGEGVTQTSVPTGAARSAPADPASLVAEIACLILALFGWALSRSATLPGDRRRLVGITMMTGGLAAFPRSWAALVVGAVLMVAWLWVAKSRPAWCLSELEALGLILVLPLPLDVLEDLLDGRPFTLDAPWLITAGAGGLTLMLGWQRRAAS